MTVYLSVRSDSSHSQSVPFDWLVAELSVWPELQRGQGELFHVMRDDESRALLNAFACDPRGGYAVLQQPYQPPEVNLIELRYGYYEAGHALYYEAILIRVAQLLSWEAWGQDDDGNDILLWPV
jgi:hypothetical protein